MTDKFRTLPGIEKIADRINNADAVLCCALVAVSGNVRAFLAITRSDLSPKEIIILPDSEIKNRSRGNQGDKHGIGDTMINQINKAIAAIIKVYE